MKKQKILQRIIALVLIAAMLWQTDSMRFFSTAFAAEIESVVAEETDVTLEEEIVEEETQVPVTVLGEVEELRTEDGKHFRMSDGSFMAVSFGMPVHYQDAEGQWQEIDNRMVLSEDQSSYGTYNMQSTTSFATSLSDGILFETSYGDTSVSMSLLDIASANVLSSDVVPVVGQEVQIQALDQGVLTEMADSDLLMFDRTAIADTTVEVFDVFRASGSLSNSDDSKAGWTMEDILPENIQDSLLYADVFPGVDLLYTKYSHNVKEQIIVNEPQSSYRYDFKLTLEGVEAVLNENGSVSLKDEETEEEIYYIPAPYMEDANGRRSYDVAYILSNTIDGVVLSVIADSDWMDDAERAFPVAIDPTLIITGGTGEREIYASYTAEGAPNSTNSGETFIGYTTWNARKEYQGFAGFEELPSIPQGMTVVKAYFQMVQTWYDDLNCDELGIGVYEVTESKPSNLSYREWIYGLTWNTKPDYDDSNMIDYTFVSGSSVGLDHKWDITELVKKWYIEGSTTRAIAMTMLPGHYDNTHHAEASFYEYDSAYPPILAVYYRDMVGIEPYYTYQTLGVGDAGVAYIADATGQLKVVNPLITFASTVNPFALSLVYNSDHFQSSVNADYQPPTKMGKGNVAMKLGQGWTLDIIQTMKWENIDDTNYICYQDGDGTRHYFLPKEPSDGYYYDEDGLGLKVDPIETQQASFVMSDESGNSWTFAEGRLCAIVDKNNNFYSISYNSSNRISEIKQTNGPVVSEVTSFTYSGDYVSSITDMAGNRYSFTYENGKLTGISRNGTQIATYRYATNGNRLIGLVDAKSEYACTFAFRYGKVVGGITNVREINEDNFGVSYPNYSKTVYSTSSPEGSLLTNYLFDHAGRTINAYVTDADNNILGASNAVYVDTADSSENVNKKVNRTEKIGGIGAANPTLFHNGGCEHSGWTFPVNIDGVRTASYSNEKHRTGFYSIKMVSENENIALFASSSSMSLTANTTYTLSAYVRTKECTSITGKGIILRVTDTSDNSFTGKGISYITTDEIDEGWSRIHVTFTALNSGIHTIQILAEGTIGTFYVDDVQLEEGTIPGTLNLLKNGSMETDSCGWTCFNGAGYSSGTGWGNSRSMKITGDPLKEAYIQQSAVINLPATETFVLSGWAKGNAVPDNMDTQENPEQDTHKQFGLRVQIIYKNGPSEYHYVPFHPEVSEWQFASLTIVPKRPNLTISTIRVICTYEGNANAAYFDNICLSREVAQTMRYDEEGNLESVSTTGLSEDVNTYEGGNLIRTATGGNGTYTYSYDETYTHRLTEVTDGVVTQELSYDRFGNTIGTTLRSNSSSNPLNITTSATYSSDGNRITELTDAAGNSISYSYDTPTSVMYGLPTSTTDGRGNSTYAAYDSEGRTTEVTVPQKIEVLYSYSQGLLTSIERNALSEDNTQEYRFTYDRFGRTTEIHIGETLLATYTYRDNGDIISMTYGNGTRVSYQYDILGRVIKETYSEDEVNGRTVEYFYDSNGQICSVVDSVSGTTNYIYDKLGRLVYLEQEETGVRSRYVYDANNRLVYTAYQIEDGHSGTERYSYNSNSTDNISDGTLTGMQLVTALGLTRSYDSLQRLTERRIPIGLVENYTYAAGEEANTTTTQVSGKKNTLGDTVVNDFQYTYNENGNIFSVKDTVTGETIYYGYDVQNQLVSAVYSTGKIESYRYDEAGNILSFNNGTTSHTYTYGNSDWRDQLTAVDGVEFTYDAIGNPLTYHNGSTYTMSWTEGRKLATITVDGETTSYLYDADGIRIQKTYSDGSSIRYINAGGKVLGEKHYSAQGTLTKQLRYIFDENGMVCGYLSSTDGTTWTQYHFITNLQGDVLHVYRVVDKAIVVSYSYDSWGNILSATGELAEENPFRYRGYYYDAETGFYYLNSRYYDAEIGRWINADGYVSTGQGMLGTNMFAYCNNSPITYKDTTGERMVSVLQNSVGGAIGTGYTDADRVIINNQEIIKEAAETYNVDPCVLAGCIYVEQNYNYNIRDELTDVIGFFMDTSVGVSQIKISTVCLLEANGYIEEVGSGNFKGLQIAKRLRNDDVYNINCAAAYLNYLQVQWSGNYDVSQDPAIWGTLYNMGERKPNPNPKSNWFGEKVKNNVCYMEILLY